MRFLFLLGVIVPMLLSGQAPEISVVQTSLSATVDPGQSSTLEVVIENTGDAQLEWSIQFTDRFAPGQTVAFSKANFANWLVAANQDRINDNVWITRADNQSLFNIKTESSSSSSSPAGTQWAIGGVNEVLVNEFTSFTSAHGGDPQSLIDQNVSLFLPASNEYYEVVFSSYTGGGNGGGFAYERTRMFEWMSASEISGVVDAASSVSVFITLEAPLGILSQEHVGAVVISSNDVDEPETVINTSLTVNEGAQATVSSPSFEFVVPAGESSSQSLTIDNPGVQSLTWLLREYVEFNKPASSDWTLPENQDRITDNVWITRQNTQGIFNIAQEDGYDRNGDRQAPTGTEWVLGATLDQNENSNYTTWYNHWRPFFYGGSNLIGRTSSLHLIQEDLYYDIQWTSWGQGNGTGGVFGYIRSEPFPEWLSLSQNEGEVSGGGNTMLDIQVDASNLLAGSYSFDLKLRSNDASQPVIVIPISLQVTGSGMISVPSAYDFGSVLIGNQSTYNLEIYNNGADVLNISSISSDNEQFFSLVDELTLQPGEAENVTVKYVPSTEGESTATLTILSNDPESSTTEISLSGIGVSPPAISVSSFSVSEALTSGETDTQTLTIENTGDSDLIVSLKLTGDLYNMDENRIAVGPTVSFSKENYADDTDPQNQDFITPNVILTRGDNAPLYNVVNEPEGYDDGSPTGTLWALGTSLSPESEYMEFRDLRDVLPNSLADLPGNQVSAYLIEENLYVDFTFQQWTVGEDEGGGGFAYTRTGVNSWVSLSANDIVIPAGESVDLDIVFDAYGFSSGSYAGVIEFETNVPQEPSLEVALALEVTGEPVADVEVSVENITETLASGTATTSSIVIENTGSRAIDWSVSLDGFLSKDSDGNPVGPKKVFFKENYADWELEENQDQISPTVWLTRADDQGIFNIASETSYSIGSPAGTEWAMGYTLDNPSSYSTWYDLHNGTTPQLVGRTTSLHLLDDDSYYDVTWLQWTSNANGGGFGYERRQLVKWLGLGESPESGVLMPGETATITVALDATLLPETLQNGNLRISTSSRIVPPIDVPVSLEVTGSTPNLEISATDINVNLESGNTTSSELDITNNGSETVRVSLVAKGPSVTFTKSDYADWTLEENQDRINAGLWITRANEQGLFNAATEEEGYSSNSPDGTEWALGSFNFASEYQDWREIYDGDVGDWIVGSRAIMHHFETGEYYEFEFHQWTKSGNGGGFSYTRYEIPSWLDVSQDGVYVFDIEAGGTLGLTLQFDATGVYAGEYATTLHVGTNSLADGDILVPVSMTVTGTPDISTTSTSVGFDNVYVDADNSNTILISNSGTADLVVSDVTSDNAVVTVPTPSFTVPPGEEYEMEVVFAPTTIAEFEGTLTITSNDELSSYEVQWSALSIGQPGIEITPSSLTVSVNGSEVVEETITITNTGVSTLVWSAELVVPNGTVTFTKADYADWTLEENQDRINENVWLTRADEGGLFNIAVEDEFNRDYDLGQGSPLGTEWAWGTVESNDGYDSWLEVMDGEVGNVITSNPFAMKLADRNIYFDFEFHSWTRGINEEGAGGGFSYTRTQAVTWIEPVGEILYEIPAGESIQFNLAFSGDRLPTASYLADAIIETNIPDSEPIVFSMQMDVTAGPELVELEDVDFGDVPVGGNSQVTVTVENAGFEPLEITSIVSDNPAMVISSQLSTIAPYSSGEFTVLFTPTAVESYTASISIDSNDPDGLVSFALSGAGVAGPTFDITPAQVFEATAIPGGLMSKTYTITNNGVGTLDWAVSGFFVPNSTVVFLKEDYADWNLSDNQDRITDDVWITRKDIQGIFNIAKESGYDGNTGLSPLGTKWSSGTTFSVLSGSGSYVNWYDHLEDAPFLLPGTTSSLYIPSEGLYFDIRWTEWRSGGSEVDLPLEGGGAFGYERTQAATWVDVSLASGTLEEGESQEVTVYLDAEGLIGGNYLADVVFSTSITDVDIYKIETDLTVIGTPQIEVNTTSLSYDDVVVGNSKAEVVTITNTGSGDLTVGVTIDDPSFAASEESIVVEPGDSYDLSVVFSPDAAGSATGILTLTHDDPLVADIEVALSGTGVNPPVISVDKDALTQKLFIGQLATQSFTITNTGDSDLIWELGAAGEVVTFIKADFADWNLPENQDRITEDVWITRKNERGIFNIARESEYSSGDGGGERIVLEEIEIDFANVGSPEGTLWAVGRTDEVENPEWYTSWVNHARDQGGPDDLPGTTSSLYLPEYDLYFDVEWLSWTQGVGEQGQGGGFSYIRTPRSGYLSWVFFSSRSGTIAPGGSKTITVTFNPNGDAQGDYSVDLLIKSNDQVSGDQPMFISMNVNSILVNEPLADVLINEGFGSTDIDLTGVFEDAQGDNLSFEVTSGNEAIVTTAVAGSTLTVTEVGTGSTTITVVSSDGKGSSASDMFTFRTNAIPVVTESLADQQLVEEFGNLTIDVSGLFTDADGDALTLSSASSNEAVATTSVVDGTLTVSEVNAGSANITVSADDSFGGMASETFAVSIVLGISESVLRGVMVYPNPSEANTIFLKLEGDYRGTIHVSVVNLSGQRITKDRFVKDGNVVTETIDIANLASGNYILEISTTQGTTSQRFIKK